MIDKTKNKFYLITVYFERGGREQNKKFLSTHSQGSKKFKEFMENYFTNVFPVSKKKIGFYGNVSDQITISKEDWENNKDEYAEMISEKGVCI